MNLYINLLMIELISVYVKKVGKSESGGDRGFKTQNRGIKFVDKIIFKFFLTKIYFLSF